MRDASLIPSALIDAKAIAREYLSTSLPTVWRMRAAGKLPEPIKLSSQCLRWRRCDVEAWIAAGCPSQNNNGSDVVAPEPSEIRQSPLGSEVTR